MPIMNSSFFLGMVVAIAIYKLLGIIFQMVYRKFRFHQENKTIHIPSSPTLSSTYSFSSSSCNNQKHVVFPSFYGKDVRKSFLSHIMKALESKAINVFIDNSIKRSMSIGRELKDAIRGSRIVIVIFSRNYAASSWCLNELVEIMKCREGLGLTVMTLFYDVEPTDVKKQTGDFGKAFKKACEYKTEKEINSWRLALAKVAIIAGYDCSNWDNEAAMIEKITTDISNMLNISTTSSDFTTLVGMETHMEKLEPMLYLDLDEVKMIGIWGHTGIGKTTIARFLFSNHSERFGSCVFMENVKGCERPGCSDEHGLKMHLQQQFLSQILNQKDIQIPNLGVVKDRLKDKKVLVVLDDVNQTIQLDAIAKETQWFGPGSRIIIITQDERLLKARGIKDIYKVEPPLPDEAYQIFCLNAFGQNTPKDGFEALSARAWKAIYHDGVLPSEIRSVGSRFRGMSKQEWADELKGSRAKDEPLSLTLKRNIVDELKGSRADILLFPVWSIIEIAAAAADTVYKRSVKNDEKKRVE